MTSEQGTIVFWSGVASFAMAFALGGLAYLRLRRQHPDILKELGGRRLPARWRHAFPALRADRVFVWLVRACTVLVWAVGIAFVALLILGRRA